MEQIPYRLPLVIGATGHRDLRDEDIKALEGQVAQVIERLKQDYLPPTCRFCRLPGFRRLCRWLGWCVDRETPIIVLSSLAEGADRLIARVAMKHGAKLIAPLPLPADEYRADFAHDAMPEFNDLLANAATAPIMPFVRDNTMDNVRDEERRAQQYREVGLFIVRHCHVLIALWNGEDSKAVGGTAEVVGFKRDGIPLDAAASVRASLDAPEMGPVIHILTPRAKPGGVATQVRVEPWGTEFVRSYRKSRRGAPESGATAAETQSGQDEAVGKRGERRQFESWEAFKTKVGLTYRFNREAAKLEASSRGAERLEESLIYLFDPKGDSTKKPLSEAAKDCADKLIPHWRKLYQIADSLALDRQQQFTRDWRALFLLGFLAIASFEVGTHLLFDREYSFWLILLYAALFCAVFAWFIHARRREHQERFLDYRALAEALRVSVFWKLVGIGWPAEKKPCSEPWSTVDLASPDAVADAYPIRQPSELDWVKTCLRTLELLDARRSPAEANHHFETDGDAWARTFWVDGQLDFFRGRGRERDRRAERFEKWSLRLVVLSIACAFFLFLVDAVNLDGVMVFAGNVFYWDHENWAHRTAILLIGLLPGLAAVFTGYSERRALKAQARQYDRMRVVFQRAHDLLELSTSENFARTRVLYAELGREAMEENAEWVAIYRQRPLRPPN